MSAFKKDNGDVRIGVIFVAAALFITVCILFFNQFLSRITGLDFPDNPGSFGDQFGVLNTTFAGLAFVGVICALLQQQNQIKQQARDLKEQNRRIDLQQFEIFFYKQIEFIDSLSKNVHSDKFIGDKAISEIADSVRACLKIIVGGYEVALAIPITKEDEEYGKKWCTFDNAYNDMLTWSNKFYSLIHYIRNLHLLTDSEKNFYINIVLELLSDRQKYMLQIMGCISEIEQYRVLEKFLEMENFFPLTSNLIFEEDKNISIFKEGIGFGLGWPGFIETVLCRRYKFEIHSRNERQEMVPSLDILKN